MTGSTSTVMRRMRCWPRRCLFVVAALVGLALIGPTIAHAAASPPSKPGGVVRRTSAAGGPFASPIGPGSAGQSAPANTALNPELQLRYHGGARPPPPPHPP